MNIRWSVLNIGPSDIPVEAVRFAVKHIGIGQHPTQTFGNLLTLLGADDDVIKDQESKPWM